MNKLGRKKWNVCIRERYSHGSGVITYLARYVRGGPISNRRLSDGDDKEVRFRYQDHRDGKSKLMTLSSEEFVQRVLWHVPEKGMQVIRHYGLYGRCGLELRDKCRAQLGQLPEERPVTLDLQRYWEKTGHPERLRCPVCAELLVGGGESPVEGHRRVSRTAPSAKLRTGKPRSRSGGKIFLACGVEVCLNPFAGATGMRLFSETRRVSSIVDRNGGGDPALTGPLAHVMGRLKIHRSVARYAGLSNKR